MEEHVKWEVSSTLSSIQEKNLWKLFVYLNKYIATAV